MAGSVRALGPPASQREAHMGILGSLGVGRDWYLSHAIFLTPRSRQLPCLRGYGQSRRQTVLRWKHQRGSSKEQNVAALDPFVQPAGEVIYITALVITVAMKNRSPRRRGPTTSHSHPPKPQPSPEEPAQLELLHKTLLSRKITYKGEERTLTSYADYTLHYESQAQGSFGTNLVIVEAKKEGSADTALPQLVSYLGIVSASRREQGKQNSVVYGIASDGVVFRFCRVDNAGNFSRSIPLD